MWRDLTEHRRGHPVNETTNGGKRNTVESTRGESRAVVGVSKSGAAIERHRRSAKGEGTSGGGGGGGGGGR